MQKWEYLEVEVSIPNDRAPYVLSVNHVEASKKQGFSCDGPWTSDFFNQIGEQGWELVTTISYEHHGFYTFKRPKP